MIGSDEFEFSQSLFLGPAQWRVPGQVVRHALVWSELTLQGRPETHSG